MELKNFLIALLVFGLVITAFWYAFVDAGDKYGVSISAEYENTYRNISETMSAERDNVRDIRDDVRSTEAEQDDDYGGSLIKGVFNSLRLIWNSFTSLNSMTEQVQEKMGIPDWIVLTFIAIVIVLISFAIISAVFKHPL